MDRAAIARAQRRRQAREALEFERDRAAALREQLEAIVAELEGGEIDEAAFARMEPEDVEVIRETLAPSDLDDFEDEESVDELGAAGEEDEETPEHEDERAEREAEIARLESEIASSARRQRSFERYLEALGE